MNGSIPFPPSQFMFVIGTQIELGVALPGYPFLVHNPNPLDSHISKKTVVLYAL